jgi:GNAT superfamily N-acetyltransferase
MPVDRTARLVEGYWSRFLGVPCETLRTPGVVVAPHVGLAGWRGTWIFVRAESVVISAPPERLDELRASAADWPKSGPLDAQAAAARLGARPEAVVGPSFQGWLAPERFAGGAKLARRLAASDRAALRAFREACAADDWAHGGVAETAQLFGTFEGDELVAVAGLRDRGAGACDPGVVTHPSQRRRGHGYAAVSAAVGEALARGQVVLYQTLLANRPALRIAERLGFEPFATVLAVRFEEGA